MQVHLPELDNSPSLKKVSCAAQKISFKKKFKLIHYR